MLSSIARESTFTDQSYPNLILFGRCFSKLFVVKRNYMIVKIAHYACVLCMVRMYNANDARDGLFLKITSEVNERCEVNSKSR